MHVDSEGPRTIHHVEIRELKFAVKLLIYGTLRLLGPEDWTDLMEGSEVQTRFVVPG